MRKAKIVCTLGPASSNREIISELIKNGMDVARLNFSHSDHKTHQKVATTVREESKRQKKIVSILQDLQGIKIRIGNVINGQVMLETGREVFLYPGTKDSNNESIYVSYPALLKDVKEGDTVLIDDGLIKLRVIGKINKALRAEVIEGGLLRTKKGVNLPDSKTTLQAFTEKDRNDLEFGLKIGVDYVAISFVRRAQDIDIIKRWGKKRSFKLPPLIAKIEKPEALDNIDEIMDIADGIMVARGDLGVEMATEKVPLIQKELIELANRKGKIVITATQMLESMTQHTRPTRAEATDVANAVLDGTDALMLSAETATGRYPVESLKMMDTIIRYTEKGLSNRLHSSYQLGNTFPEAIADLACRASANLKANAIVVFSYSGFTARLISKMRPNVPIIAFTPSVTALRSIPLFWGTIPKLITKVNILEEEFISEAEKILIKEGLLKKGDTIVLAASSPFLGKPNVIRLHQIKGSAREGS